MEFKIRRNADMVAVMRLQKRLTAQKKEMETKAEEPKSWEERVKLEQLERLEDRIWMCGEVLHHLENKQYYRIEKEDQELIWEARKAEAGPR